VAERFREAAETAHRLPAVRVQGYFNTWPAIQRETWEAYFDDERVLHIPPSPDAIDRMEEAMRWVLWLSEEERHLVWMRAEGWEWKEIARRFACDRTTAWRRWRRALGKVVDRLNGIEEDSSASALNSEKSEISVRA
jgi:DNA-directed RNA polymerase specialized sigma24 family protein